MDVNVPVEETVAATDEVGVGLEPSDTVEVAVEAEEMVDEGEPVDTPEVVEDGV